MNIKSVNFLLINPSISLLALWALDQIIKACYKNSQKLDLSLTLCIHTLTLLNIQKTMNLFGDIMPQLIINVISGLLIFNVLNHLPSVTSSECSSNRLVLYKVIFRTNWNRKLFPRQYPEWRPPAQWSKVVGE